MLMTVGRYRPKKSPYHEDTGIPDLLLPRCAHGITSDWHERDEFPAIHSMFIDFYRRRSTFIYC
jgi:hypothetical protein